MDRKTFSLKKGAAILWALLLTQGVALSLPDMSKAFPNVGVDAGTLPAGIVFMRDRWFYVDYTKRYDQDRDDYVDLAADEHYDSYWNLLEVAYGVTNNFTLVANLWYYDAEINVGADSGSDEGIGDFYIFSKYKIKKFNDGNPSSGLVWLAGLRLPTGDKDEQPILRLGDGSTDVGLGLAVTKKMAGGIHSVFAGVWFNVENSAADDDRHQIEFRTTSEYDIIPQKFNVQIETKGLWFEGGDEYIFELVPGFQYTPIFPLTFQASIKIPVMEKGYFGYDYQVVLGVSFGFPIH